MTRVHEQIDIVSGSDAWIDKHTGDCFVCKYRICTNDPNPGTKQASIVDGSNNPSRKMRYAAKP